MDPTTTPIRHISTVPRDRPIESVRRGRLGRRIFTGALVLFLGLGMLGLYGVRTREATASGDGYELTVTYTSITRPGLATPWAVEITRPGGFGDELVTIAVTSKYFDSFDENGLDPDPAESLSDGENTIWRFEPPPGDVMAVSFDARIEPGVQLKTVKGTVAALDEAGTELVSVDFRTLVLP